MYTYKEDSHGEGRLKMLVAWGFHAQLRVVI